MDKFNANPIIPPSAHHGADGGAAVSPASASYVAPMSHVQTRMWFLEKYSNGAPLYLIPLVVSIRGDLVPELLEESMNDVIARHEALRTTVGEQNGFPVQIIRSAVNVPLNRVDMNAVPAEERILAAHEYARRRCECTFDLASGPLIRGDLLMLTNKSYLFVLVVHHIICDGWSMDLLMQEIVHAYQLRSGGSIADPPKPSIHYPDYAIWEREIVESTILPAQLPYWQKQLSGLEPLRLPYDHQAPGAPLYRGASIRRQLSSVLVTAVRCAAQERQVTMFMFLLTALNLILSRYCGQADVAVGVPVSVRVRKELESVVGCFVNTILLRTRLIGDPTVGAILEQVRATALNGYANQELPFDRVVEAMAPDRHASANSLVKVMFLLQNAERSSIVVGPDLTIQRLEIIPDVAHFDLSVSASERANGLAIVWNYPVGLFQQETIRQIARDYEILLEAMTTHPEQCLSGLPLGEAVSHVSSHLREEQVKTGLALGTVVDLIEAMVESHPLSHAVVCGGRRMTYRELNNAANRLARVLLSRNIRSESRVGICLEKTPEMIVAVLATWKVGAAYVPLDPEYPQERLLTMLSQVNTALVITDRRNAGAVDVPGGNYLLTEDWGQDTGEDESNVPMTIDARQLAYIIFTSGSTGMPKAVMVEHGSLRSVYAAWKDVYSLESTPCSFLQLAAFGFDVCTGDIVRSLCSGGTLILCDRDTVLDPKRLLSIIKSERARCGEFVPATARLLVEYVLQEKASLDPMKLIIVGSEQWYEREYLALRGVCSHDTRIFNSYGIVEATIDSACAEVSASICKTSDGKIELGYALPGSDLYVLDKWARPVPYGVVGELHIGGPTVARGYYASPVETAMRFIPNPFGNEPGGRMYKTGDLVRCRREGVLEHVGRTDDQIKMHGARIDLGEIESVIMEHHGIRACAVKVDISGISKRLVAYLEIAEDLPSARGGRALESAGAGRIDEWKKVFDDLYGSSGRPSGFEYDIAGWNSSYTGLPMERREVDEWRAQTSARILSLEPSSVLEVGCGSGLILQRVAPNCRSYVGTDLSSGAVARLRDALEKDPHRFGHVHIVQASADEVCEMCNSGVDTVLLVSVIQYFPSWRYLRDLIVSVLPRIADGGRMFIGDVRSLPLLNAFYTAVELEKAADDTSVVNLRQRIETAARRERQLVLDPAAFWSLATSSPVVSDVEIMLEAGRYQNELTKFRYDVVLRTGGAGKGRAADADENIEIQWGISGDIRLIEERLLMEQPERATVRGVPDARVGGELCAVRLLSTRQDLITVRDLKAAVQREQSESVAVEPGKWWEMEKRLPYNVDVFLPENALPGEYDVRFRRRTSKGKRSVTVGTARWAEPKDNRADIVHSNEPLRAEATDGIVAEIRLLLKRKLPKHMVPAVIVPIEYMPLTPNGKRDKDALPVVPEKTRERQEKYIAPRTKYEKEIAEIWIAVLGHEYIGINENFFDSGGDSITATQVMSRIRSVLGVELPLRIMFDEGTIEALAKAAQVVGESASDDVERY